MSNKSELQSNNNDLQTLLALVNDMSGAVPIAGGTMTGALLLHDDPTTNMQAATKRYVDNAVAVHVASAVVG